MKTFKFSLVLRTRENTDVFITLDDNIYGIHSKRGNILYICYDHTLHNTSLLARTVITPSEWQRFAFLTSSAIKYGGLFIWNLSSPKSHFINSIWNDHSCKILYL